jgi:hypothetical protein
VIDSGLLRSQSDPLHIIEDSALQHAQGNCEVMPPNSDSLSPRPRKNEAASAPDRNVQGSAKLSGLLDYLDEVSQQVRLRRSQTFVEFLSAIGIAISVLANAACHAQD